MSEDFELGITKEFTCNYLPGKKERLLVATDLRLHNSERYAWLMSQGFRRSGDQIYRPHCLNCNACQSLRVITNQFTLSKSQKRSLKRNKSFQIKTSNTVKDCYYPLYENYINTIHRDGTMYPATYEQYEGFLTSTITQQLYIEIWDDNNLISVAVTDILTDALSAVYTFYHPDYKINGLGVFSILKQIEIAKSLNKNFLYLGYQIDDCKKMNYKNRYFPHQRLQNNTWLIVNK